MRKPSSPPPSPSPSSTSHPPSSALPHPPSDSLPSSIAAPAAATRPSCTEAISISEAVNNTDSTSTATENPSEAAANTDSAFIAAENPSEVVCPASIAANPNDGRETAEVAVSRQDFEPANKLRPDIDIPFIVSPTSGFVVGDSQKDNPNVELQQVTDSQACTQCLQDADSKLEPCISDREVIEAPKSDSEVGNSRLSFWSSLVARGFTAACSRPPNSSSSSWNAAVRRAVTSGPMKRLQERLLGSRWATPAPSRSDIWLLGACYPMCEDGSSCDPTSSEICTEFLSDFMSRIWFTYRKGFEAIGSAKLTTDVGWGCMLRSGQMLLAQALICHYLGRGWRKILSEPYDREYLKILQCFGDRLGQESPFSIHNILEAGGRFGLVAGSWLGPYALCRALEALAHSIRESSTLENPESILPLAVYVVSGDGEGERGGAPCICIDDVARLCCSGRDAAVGWSPLLLLVPLVLGLDKVNPRYLPSLWATFTFPQSLGIAGGKPGASTYLVGVQDDQVLYLDPHEVQQTVLVSADKMDVDTSSYHCSVVKKMPLSAIDPSLALGFYCRNQDEFDDLCARATQLARESNGAPMFTVVKSTSKDADVEPQLGETLSASEESASQEEDWQIL